MLKRHPKKLIALVALLGATFYLFWPGLSPDLSESIDSRIGISDSFGVDTGAGNVVGIEPYMVPLDYASKERFQAKLDAYLAAADREGWLKQDTVVLLPEHIGTWLMAVDQGSRVYNAADTTGAMLPLVMHNLGEFLKNLYIFDDPDNVSAALFRTRTKASAEAQFEVYGALARKYSITLVAGSSALMTPGVYPDGLSYGHGPVFNAGFVFGPDGSPINDAVRKVHPIPSETGFTTASRPEYLPTFKVGNRTMGMLICADSWFDDTTSFMAGEGVDLLLVPSFLEGTSWDTPWGGYLNDTPNDQSWRTDVGTLTEGEAWIKHALPGRARKHGIKWGMNVFMKGELWGMKGYGRALILEDGTLHIGKGDDESAAIYNLWLN